jgi:hypothetical protein
VVFSPWYLSTTGRQHILALLVLPPFLLAGFWSLTRRHAAGASLAALALLAAMGCYFFVDSAPSFAESAVLAERLLLPSVVLLLVGYADLLASGAWTRRLLPVVALAPAVIGTLIGLKHCSWQADAPGALADARMEMSRLHSTALGLNYAATKVGLLFDGPVTLVTAQSPQPQVLMCNTGDASYRGGKLTAECPHDGYTLAHRRGTFEVWVER